MCDEAVKLPSIQKLLESIDTGANSSFAGTRLDSHAQAAVQPAGISAGSGPAPPTPWRTSHLAASLSHQPYPVHSHAGRSHLQQQQQQQQQEGQELPEQQQQQQPQQQPYSHNDLSCNSAWSLVPSPIDARRFPEQHHQTKHFAYQGSLSEHHDPQGAPAKPSTISRSLSLPYTHSNSPPSTPTSALSATSSSGMSSNMSSTQSSAPSSSKSSEASDTSSSPPLSASKAASLQARRTNLPKETVEILNEWLLSHLNYPYPSPQEKRELLIRTGLSKVQLSNWFINVRRRKVFSNYYLMSRSSSSPASSSMPASFNSESVVNPNESTASEADLEKRFHTVPLTRRKKLIDRLEELRRASQE
ncbi:LADA_0H04126g1_1 [Lachancea dasiensis]|uniref:LADA_0H04126g1_1 n=1 Tax=Lachancea dasiensis TaxID=1072105 RepID=A0A1G4K0I7_9SACH|nr:LADA_0H04126g1_1 [Lachancea dasiensis]